MNNIPEGYKPFNYEEAIKDLSKVRTRLGNSITELYKFNIVSKYPIVFTLEDEGILSCTIDGRFNYNGNPTYCDLFLIDDNKIVIQVPNGTYIHDFAKEVANVIVNNYGMHNKKEFIETLLNELEHVRRNHSLQT